MSQGGEIIGTSAIFLAQMPPCFEPWHSPGSDCFGNDIGLNVIILPFYTAKCCFRTLPLCTEGGSQLMVLRMYADNTRPTDYTNFRLRLSPKPSGRQHQLNRDSYLYHRFCSLYH